jgi:predicted phosphodiesterase
MLKNTRDRELSLWQSAVDEVVARSTSGSRAEDTGASHAIQRPDPTNQSMVAAAALDVVDAENGDSSPGAPPPSSEATQDIGSVVKYCSTLARNIVVDALKLDPTGASINKAELTARMGVCDPRWVDVIVKYVEFAASGQTVPYRVYQQMSDYVIEGDALPAKARVAIVGDWATGQDEAKQLLAQIARKGPNVVIHLGDIYYSCTDFEVDNYFYNIWSAELDLTKIKTFTLAGNHDMYSGGEPFYRLLDNIKQPASYFCLRNADWQFLAMDTGLNDRVPSRTVATYLQDSEVLWLKDKVQNAAGRRTILLSHHQLFTAYESIAGSSVNAHLKAQLDDMLPSVDVWLWGHEHDLVIYQPYQNVLARCIGHGAFPVGINEPHEVKFPDVPMVADIPLGNNGTFVNHGYAIIDIDGADATIAYYQDSDEDTPIFKETLGRADQRV